MMQANDDVSELIAPSWPYRLGAIGGAVFALGAMFFLFGALGGQYVLAVIALATMTVGSLIIAASWYGMVSNGRSGFAPLLGSLVFAAGIVMTFAAADASRADNGGALAAAFVAFTGFSAGHAFVRRPRATGIAAAIAFASVLAGYSYASSRALGIGTTIGAFGGLIVVGLSLAFELPTQRYDWS